MATFFGEILQVTSRAVDEDDDEDEVYESIRYLVHGSFHFISNAVCLVFVTAGQSSGCRHISQLSLMPT